MHPSKASSAKKRLFIDLTNDNAEIREPKKRRLETSETVTSLPKDAQGAMLKAIQNPQFNYIYADSYVLTHKKIADALSKKEKDGAHVSVHLGVHGSNIPLSLTNVTYNSAEHAKGIAASEKNPSLGSPGKHVIVHGSANITHKAYHNNERNVEITDNKDLFKDFVTMHLSQSPQQKHKTIRISTPTKTHFDSSQKVALNASEAQRILTAANSDAQDRIIFKTTMNFNSKEIADAITQLAKSGGESTIIVNETALAGGKNLLTSMNKAGVNVYVANNHTQHSKLLVRQIGQDYYSLIGTNNATSLGDSERNRTFGSHNPQLAQDIIQELKQYTKEKCVPLKQALTKYDQAKKLKLEGEKKLKDRRQGKTNNK